MYAVVDGVRRLAVPDGRGRCPRCDQDVTATRGEIRLWHWDHSCDPWAEIDTEWHLGWKRLVPADRAETVIDRDGVKHVADVVCLNGAVLELQEGPITASGVREREAFYRHVAWLFRVTWASDLRYGKKGFWWRHGHTAQAVASRPLFWHFEKDGIVQEVKLGLSEDGKKILGRAKKTYKWEAFGEFIATGKLS